jgi:M6 family metalloprotease-like protein
MNWTDYSETDASIWHDKFFNKNTNSVEKYYQETSLGKLNIIPVKETSGSINDGIIMVDMGIAHPGGANNAVFRDTHIYNAIKNSEVVNNINFQDYDKDNNGNLDIYEMQIIFIVAGGEESFGDNIDTSIWAHAWAFSSNVAPVVDGVRLMSAWRTKDSSGSYSRFGANHGDHKATIGIMVHELGHAMLMLRDLYDDGGGSGLGWYDVMSSGSWGKQVGDQYPGDTPTQFSTYQFSNGFIRSRPFSVYTTAFTGSNLITIKCSSFENIEIGAGDDYHEYFMIECRDTQKANSDIAFNTLNPSFQNRLLALIYHIDNAKTTNNEDGIQTSSNHYNIAILEKDSSTNVMTAQIDIQADYNDVYIQGDVIESSKTNLYYGDTSGYRIEVTNEDYVNRTMTIKISK